jgi:hypothetical protein
MADKRPVNPYLAVLVKMKPSSCSLMTGDFSGTHFFAQAAPVSPGNISNPSSSDEKETIHA